MRVVIQRVLSASCIVDDKITGAISQGLMLLVGFRTGDNIEVIQKSVKKIVNMRIFSDKDGHMNDSLLDSCGNVLSISQFTLYGSFKKGGNRPSFTESMAYDKAKELYEIFNKEFLKYNVKVETGIFGADMKLNPICDGPVTILWEEDCVS